MHVGLLLLGIIAGAFSGLFGIGGGLVIVPALYYVFGFNQHEAQGTSLAVLVPPIGILAAWEYYRQGFVRVPVALLIVLGFAFGAWFTATQIGKIGDLTLHRLFGGLMVTAGLLMMFRRG